MTHQDLKACLQPGDRGAGFHAVGGSGGWHRLARGLSQRQGAVSRVIPRVVLPVLPARDRADGGERGEAEAARDESLGVVATELENARLYYRFRPMQLPLAVDPTLATHRSYRVPKPDLTPQMMEAVGQIRVDPNGELPAPMALQEAAGMLDKVDGFQPTAADQRDAQNTPAARGTVPDRSRRRHPVGEHRVRAARVRRAWESSRPSTSCSPRRKSRHRREHDARARGVPTAHFDDRARSTIQVHAPVTRGTPNCSSAFEWAAALSGFILIMGVFNAGEAFQQAAVPRKLGEVEVLSGPVQCADADCYEIRVTCPEVAAPAQARLKVGVRAAIRRGPSCLRPGPMASRYYESRGNCVERWPIWPLRDSGRCNS